MWIACRWRTSSIGLAAIILVAPFGVGCQGEEGEEAAAVGNLEKSGERVELRCYEWRVSNGGERSIFDVRVPLEGEPLIPSGPPGWGVDPEGDGLVFRTPPPGSEDDDTVPRPQPIPSGEDRGPFRFYLERGTGPVRTSGPVEVSFEDGSAEAARGITQGGAPVPVSDDGFQHIRPTDTAYCWTLEITAPPARAVHDVHLEGDREQSPEFVGVDPPEGWVSNPVDPDTITIFAPGGEEPLPPGGTISFKVYYTRVNGRLHWRFTDERGQTIPGAEGDISLVP